MSKITYSWVTIDIFPEHCLYLLYCKFYLTDVLFTSRKSEEHPNLSKRMSDTLRYIFFQRFFVEVIDAERNIIKQITVILSFHRVNISRPILGKQVHSRGTYLYGFTI